MKFLPLRHQDLQGFQVHQRFQELRWQAFLQTGHAGPTRHAGDQVNEAKELMVGPWANSRLHLWILGRDLPWLWLSENGVPKNPMLNHHFHPFSPFFNRNAIFVSPSVSDNQPIQGSRSHLDQHQTGSRLSPKCWDRVLVRWGWAGAAMDSNSNNLDFAGYVFCEALAGTAQT